MGDGLEGGFLNLGWRGGFEGIRQHKFMFSNEMLVI